MWVLVPILLTVVLAAVPVEAAERPQGTRCEYRGASPTDDGRTWHWSYAVGAELKGSSQVDLDGDGRPEHLQVVAQIQRDYAINAATGERSERPVCWFHTRLQVRTGQRQLLYADEWSIKYEDMPTLLETHGASSPEDYVARFARHRGYFTSGVEAVGAADAEIQPEAIEWSLGAQGIKGRDPEAIARELSGLKTLRVLTYRAEWREDVRMVAYVPSLRRAVAIQVGY